MRTQTTFEVALKTLSRRIAAVERENKQLKARVKKLEDNNGQVRCSSLADQRQVINNHMLRGRRFTK